jgi:hypothetical protein
LIQQSQLTAVGKLLLQYWPIVILLSTGLSLAFHAGYFMLPLGINFFHVSVEDLSKTGLMIALLAGGLYGFTPVLTAIGIFESKLLKMIVILVGVTFFLIFPLFELYSIWDTRDVAVIRSMMANAVCKGVGVLAILALYFGHRNQLVNFDLLALTYLALIVICFTYGAQVFYDDIRNSKTFTLRQEASAEVVSQYVTERTYFYLLFDPSTCAFHVAQKSGWTFTSILPPMDVNRQDLQTNSCLLARTPFGELVR